MSFTSFFATAINKGAKLTKGPAEVAAHFDGLVAAAKVGRALDPAALDAARTAYRNLLESLPKGSARSEAERDFATEVVQAVGKELDKKDAFMKALGADGIADSVLNAEAKAAKKGAQAADKVSQTLSGLTPKTTSVEGLDASLKTLRADLGKAGLIDANAASKPRTVKDIRGALEGGQPITQAEFTRFASGLRQESLVAERGRLVTQIERATTTPDGRADAALFDRLETLRADKDYPKGKGASTNDALADLKAGRPVSDDSLTALRNHHTRPVDPPAPPAPLQSSVPGLTANDVTRLGTTFEPTEALVRFPTLEDQRKWLTLYNHVQGPSITNNIRDAAGKLESLARTKDRIGIEEFFGTLRNHLRDSSQERLLETGMLNRRETTSPREITSLLRSGEAISEAEFDTLKHFFVKHHSETNVSSQAGVANPYPMASGSKWAVGAQAVAKAHEMFSRVAAEAPKRASRNAAHEWETGAAPGLPSRVINTMLDNPFLAGIPAITLAGHLGGYGFYQYGADLTSQGRTGTILANYFLPGEGDLKDVPEANDVVGGVYTRIIRNTEGNSPNSTFSDLTKKITGIDFTKERVSPDSDKTFSEVPFNMNSLAHAEMFRKLIEKSQGATPSSSGVTADALTAYKLALSKMMGIEKPTSDPQETAKAWAQKLSDQMKQNNDLRKEVVLHYYGKDVGFGEGDHQALTQLSSRRGVSSSEMYFTAMSEYLVKTGKLDKIETAQDPKLLAEFIEKKITASVSSDSEKNAIEMRTRSSAGAETTAKAPSIDLDDAFNGLTADNTFGMKGKESILREAYRKALVNGVPDPSKLDEELKTAGIGDNQREVVKTWVREAVKTSVMQPR